MAGACLCDATANGMAASVKAHWVEQTTGDIEMKKKRSCKKCGFWVVDSECGRLGGCRRNAPVVLFEAVIDAQTNDTTNYNAVWPNTLAHDWCGEFSQYER